VNQFPFQADRTSSHSSVPFVLSVVNVFVPVRYQQASNLPGRGIAQGRTTFLADNPANSAVCGIAVRLNFQESTNIGNVRLTTRDNTIPVASAECWSLDCCRPARNMTWIDAFFGIIASALICGLCRTFPRKSRRSQIFYKASRRRSRMEPTMTIHIELKPAQDQAFLERARLSGRDPARYAQQIIRDHLASPTLETNQAKPHSMTSSTTSLSQHALGPTVTRCQRLKRSATFLRRSPVHWLTKSSPTARTGFECHATSSIRAP
jgi:hypothetical protein